MTPRPLGKAVSSAISRYLKTLLMEGDRENSPTVQAKVTLEEGNNITSEHRNRVTGSVVVAAGPSVHVRETAPAIEPDKDRSLAHQAKATAAPEVPADLSQDDGSVDIDTKLQVPAPMRVEMTKTRQSNAPKPGHIHFAPPSLGDSSSVLAQASGCVSVANRRLAHAQVSKQSKDKTKFTNGVNRGLLLMPGYNINRYETSEADATQRSLTRVVDGPGGKTVTVEVLTGTNTDNAENNTTSMERITAVNAVNTVIPKPRVPAPPGVVSSSVMSESSTVTHALQCASSIGNTIDKGIDHYYESLQTRPAPSDLSDAVQKPAERSENRANEGVLEGMSDSTLQNSTEIYQKMFQINSWDVTSKDLGWKSSEKFDESAFVPIHRESDIIIDGVLKYTPKTESDTSLELQRREGPSLADTIISDILDGTAATLLNEFDALVSNQARSKADFSGQQDSNNQAVTTFDIVTSDQRYTEGDDDICSKEHEGKDTYDEFHTGSLSVGVAAPDRKLGRDALLLLYEGINDYEDSEIRYNASEESEFEAPSCTNNGDKECSQEFDNASTSEVYDDVGSGAQKEEDEETLLQIAQIVQDMCQRVEESATTRVKEDRLYTPQSSLVSAETIREDDKSDDKSANNLTFAEYAAHIEAQRTKSRHPPVRTVGKRLYGAEVVEMVRSKRKRDREAEAREQPKQPSSTLSPHRSEPSHLAETAPRSYSSLLAALSNADATVTAEKNSNGENGAPIASNRALYQSDTDQIPLHRAGTNTQYTTKSKNDNASLKVIHPPKIELNAQQSSISGAQSQQDERDRPAAESLPMAALGTTASHQSSQADSGDTSVMDLTPQQSCVLHDRSASNEESTAPDAAKNTNGTNTSSTILQEVESAATALLLSMLGPIAATGQQNEGDVTKAATAESQDTVVPGETSKETVSVCAAAEGIAQVQTSEAGQYYQQNAKFKAAQQNLLSNLHDPYAWGKLAAELAVREGELIRNRRQQDLTPIDSVTVTDKIPSIEQSGVGSKAITSHSRPHFSTSRPDISASGKRVSPPPTPPWACPPFICLVQRLTIFCLLYPPTVIKASL